jgi:hypothetical protein
MSTKVKSKTQRDVFSTGWLIENIFIESLQLTQNPVIG